MRLLPFAAAARTADPLFTIRFRSAFLPGVSAKGHVRGSASARLGQVQGGSRRMRPPKFLPTGHGGGARVRPRFRPARSLSIRTADEQEELAQTVRGGVSADGYPMAGDDPPAPLTSGIDRALRLSTAAAVLAATLTANMAQGWSHGPVGAVIAAWPAVSLVGSYELLLWLIRTYGTADRGPSAGHLRSGAAYCSTPRPVPARAADGERPGGSE